MKNILSADFVTAIIKEVREMESIGMVYLIFLTIILFIADLLHLKYGYPYPENLRVFYIVLFTITSTYYVNKISRKRRLAKEEHEADFFKKQQQIAKFKNITKKFSLLEKEILAQFLNENSTDVQIPSQYIYAVNSMKEKGLPIHIEQYPPKTYAVISIELFNLMRFKRDFAEYVE